MPQAVVVIPIYQTKFSDEEWLSLRQTFKILGHYDVAIVYPKGLDISELKDKFKFIAKPVDPKYFGSIKAYNKLVLSKFFYQIFEEYEYMLICQSDVMIFKDDLLSWCTKGYDYIGAPWVNSYWLVWHNVLLKDGIINALKCLLSPRFYNAVGNGGLSLRRTSAFLRAFDQAGVEQINWKSNEDFYWGIFAPQLKIPKSKDAFYFAIETHPRESLKKIGNQLPFGVHAWMKFDPKAWTEAIEKVKLNLD